MEGLLSGLTFGSSRNLWRCLLFRQGRFSLLLSLAAAAAVGVGQGGAFVATVVWLAMLFPMCGMAAPKNGHPSFVVYHAAVMTRMEFPGGDGSDDCGRHWRGRDIGKPPVPDGGLQQ